jgi:hypothetical protein
MEAAHRPGFDIGEAVRENLERIAAFRDVALAGLRVYMGKKEKENLAKIREESGQVEKDQVQIRGAQMHRPDDDDDHEQGGRITRLPGDNGQQ